jgi:membrane protein implicated in regulation of membrane protease activity
MDPVKRAVTQDEIIASFEFAFMVVFGVGLLSTTNFIVMNYPLAGIMLILCAALLLLLARAVRRRKNIPRSAGKAF